MDPNTFPTKGNLILAKNSLKLAHMGYELSLIHISEPTRH